MGRFLRLFTTLSIGEIVHLEKLQGAEINEGKKVLADQATQMLHGREAASQAREAAEAAFERGALSSDLPTFEVARADLEAGIPDRAPDRETRASGAGSGGEARRLAQGGGLRLNDAAISDGNHLVTAKDLNADGVLKLAAGKKKIVLVKPV